MTEQIETNLKTTETIKESLKAAIASAVQQAAEEAVQEAMTDKKPEIKRAIEQAAEAKTREEDSPNRGSEMDFQRRDACPHAFVVMPFGKKKGADGAIYDFNAI